MASGFDGFPQEGLDFFRKLKKNNKREWFQPRKQIFDEKVKAPMIQLAGAVNAQLARFAPEHIVEPAKAIYRIYRDTRFSNDKTPYKTHIAVNFPRQGLEKHAGGGFYFSVGADEIEVAGGVYMPGPEQLLAIRQHIAANYKAFAKLAGGKAVRELMGEMHGNPISRVPKGFAADHPAAEYLKCRRWIFYRSDIDPKIAATTNLLPEIVKRLKAMTPFVHFLNEPLLKLSASQKAAAMLDSF
jgi:uncharacterized protein (TIGR02453 family)